MNLPPPRPVLAFLLAAGVPFASAADPAPAAKPYRLFMGSNLSIVSKDTSLQVNDVRRNSFVVHGPAGEMVIDPLDSRFQLKIDDTLKLTDDIARVDNLSFERAYTPENDPMKKFADASRTSAYLDDNKDEADSKLRMAQIGVGLNQGAVTTSAANGANPAITAMAETNLGVALAQQSQAEAMHQRAQSMTNMDVFSTTSTSNRLTSDIAAEMFDALRVTFEVSAPKPLQTPYVVIFMRFLAQKNRPDTASTWVYAEKLPDLDSASRKVTIYRGGFPPGYQIESHQVHLYEGYSEVATNVSRRLMELSTDEAFQYAVIQHITANRHRTKAPAKATFFWPRDLSSRVLPDKLTRQVYVKVDRTGRAVGIFEDEACRQPVADAEIAALTPELRFFPALQDGKSIEGLAAIKLGTRD